jgi:Methyltransferase domain
MRDRWDFSERLFAAYYPRLMQRSENAGQRQTRAGLLAGASGATLEIGAGSGANLPHYSERVTELVVSEPSPHTLEHLRRALDDGPPPVGSYRLVQAGAQELPFADASFAAGSHPNRRTASLIEQSPLELDSLHRGRQPKALPSVRPTIVGAARRPV